MQTDFTPEILVKHLYNETSLLEAQAIRNALVQDETLQEKFKELQTAKTLLDENGGDEPDAETIKSILSYAKRGTVVV